MCVLGVIAVFLCWAWGMWLLWFTLHGLIPFHRLGGKVGAPKTAALCCRLGSGPLTAMEAKLHYAKQVNLYPEHFIKSSVN